MVDLASQNLMSLEPPREPVRPSKPQEAFVPAYVLKALGVAFAGVFVGSVVGGVLGVGVSILASSSTRTLAERHSAGGSAWLGTIVVCAFIGGFIFFLQGLSEESGEAHARQQRIDAYRRGLENYKRDREAYKKAIEAWPAELERRKALNAAIAKARQERAEALRREQERQQELERSRKEWDQKAAFAYHALLGWRTDFLAECVARYGKRSPEELERLYIEAYPYSPVSGDPRMGCLHHYAKEHMFIGSVQHLLPQAVARP